MVRRLHGAYEILDNRDEWSVVHLPTGRGVRGRLNNPNEVFVDEHPLPDVTAVREAMLSTDLVLTAELTQPPAVGSANSISLAVTNSGPRPASEAVVSVTLPPGVTVTAVPDGCDDFGGGLLMCLLNAFADETFHPLAPGELRTYDIQILVGLNPGTGVREILVHTSHQGTDLNPQDNTVVLPIVTAPPFLRSLIAFKLPASAVEARSSIRHEMSPGAEKARPSHSS